MPLYQYLCENCGHLLDDVYQSINDKPLKRCPECKKHKLERQIFPVHGSVRGEITTLGQQGEANAKRLGKYYASEKKAIEAEAKKQQEEKSKSWFGTNREDVKKLGNLTPEKKQKYIHTGEI